MAVCAHCKARHWECKGRTGHFSTCCSQGKVQLPPLSGPIPSIDSYSKEAAAFRENARSYNNLNALHSRTPHVSDISTPLPSTRRTLGALNPAVNQRPTFAKTWLICPAEATDTQLGPDGADSRIQISTLTKLNSTLRTGNFFVREFASAKARAARSIRLRYLSVTHYSSPQRKVASTSTFLFARSTKLGHSLPKDRDEDEGDAENGDGELSRSQLFAYDLHKRDEYFSIPHCTQRAFLAFVMTDTPRSRPIDSTYLQLDQENLRLTTGQGIISLTPDQVGCSVILGSTFENRPRENTQRYQDAMACVVKYGKPSLFITVTCNPEWPETKAALEPNDQASNRPEFIARAFEAKLNRLCDDNVFWQQATGTLFVNGELFLCCSCGPPGRLWWMYQHTVVSAAPACGVHVPIRSHVQALW
ncbi:BQ5605_C043g12082 [Microbotryum silenes-dioicae]|uniref:BQ5605_C043g12082 protein n=1 Tax=Microbotryum silenes-dioicae TaxID=796604 RepID=A0A2X0MTC4_9BASI|nr:BQ5605_C043g12082 [Microbotryum silenes-dioicae]